MAERERLTKKELRERSREDRKRKEAEATKKRQRDRLRNSLVAVVIIAVIGGTLYVGPFQRWLNPTALDDQILVSSQAAADARDAAGCEVLTDRNPLPDRSHIEMNQFPDPDAVYTDVRPTHSGPHTPGLHPVIADGARSQIDERSSTHNLEHGAVMAWYDPDQVDRSAVSDMGNWAGTLNANGFRVDRAGVAIFVAPYEDPGISSGKAVAFRAWGTAMDCDSWDETVANAFVIEHYGTHGIAPERTFAPYPTEVLAFTDREVDDSDAPIGDDPDHLDDAEADDTEAETDEAEDPAED